VETLLVVFLAPASTAGAISLEREKQTLDMLAATPISSLAIVVGKLLSALAYVFLLIAASIPLTAIVFVFGGVSPDDVIRAYVVLIVSTIGLGSLGLFISAVAQRTQGATVVTFFAVLALSLGTMFSVLFWNQMAGLGRNAGGGVVSLDGTNSSVPPPETTTGLGPISGRPPEVLLWFNPFAAQYDVICGASDGYGGWCNRLRIVTNGAISVNDATMYVSVPATGIDTRGSGVVGVQIDPTAPDAAAADDLKRKLNLVAANPNLKGGAIVTLPAPDAPVVGEVQAFGPRRDLFWPQSVAAWGIVSVALILMSVQLVSPTRRWRWSKLLPGRRA
jgi:hypothetical protein